MNADRHRAAEEAETHRMMDNWVRWKLGGVSISVGMFLTGLGARGTRSDTPMPLANGEAMDVDAAVEGLPDPLRQVVHAHWLHELPDRRGRPRRAARAPMEQRARALRCSVRTYWRRLGHAHERVRALMRAKRAAAERARHAYRTKGVAA